MNLIQRGIALFIIIFLLFFTLIGINFYREKKEEEHLRASLSRVYLSILEKSLQMYSTPVKNYLKDLTIWDESVSYIKNRNRVYAADNIDASGDVYGIGETWVYTADFRELYYYNNRSIAAEAGDLKPIISSLIKRAGEERFFTFHYKKNDTIFEITVSSIHPNGDKDRKTDPAGYIVTAIPYDENFIQRLKSFLPQIQDAEIQENKKDTPHDEFVLPINEAFKDINGDDIAYIHLLIKSSYLKDISADRRFQKIFILFFIAAFLIVGVTLRYGIVIPLKEIYTVLFRHDYTPSPDKLRYISPEFKEIMNLVELNRTVEMQLGDALTETAKQKEIAEKATKTKTEFLANMSHEIRTPMAGVLGFSDMLLDITTDPAQKELATGIKTSAEAIMSIINDILDMSKIESGKFILLNEPFNINSFLDNYIWILRGFAAERELDIRLENRVSHCTTVTGDIKRLRQILLNLGSNAIKYTIEGEVVITADSAPAGDGEIDLIITVQDTGIGMNEKQLSKIFRQYEQVHDPASFSGGTGLGLAITKSLVTVMGGTLDVESEPGKGSTFTLRLRMTCVEGESPKPSLINAKNLGLKILLAEDNPISMKVIENIVGKAGCISESVFNGQDVIESAGTEKFDLILMDFHMPAVSGIEAASIIRSGNGPNRETPIYGISADLIERSIEYSGRAGMKGYLMKPFIIEEVYKVLMKIRDEKENSK
ncbi:MAG TPA: ATP-binding protein [Spirochaetota bacterium]|nr:ATP-binding protein [Spirochaetota bacterium]